MFSSGSQFSFVPTALLFVPLLPFGVVVALVYEAVIGRALTLSLSAVTHDHRLLLSLLLIVVFQVMFCVFEAKLNLFVHLVRRELERDNAIGHLPWWADDVAEVDLGVAHLRLDHAEDHLVVVHDLGRSFDDAECVENVGVHAVELGVSVNNCIDIDVFILVSKLTTMIDWTQHINLINGGASEPEGVLKFNILENAGEGDRRLQYLDHLLVRMLHAEGMVAACENVGDAKVHVTLQAGCLEEMLDEFVEVAGIIYAIFIEEAIDHAPAPRFDKIIVLLSNFEPEVDELV